MKRKLRYGLVFLVILICTFFLIKKNISTPHTDSDFQISQFLDGNWKELYNQSFGIKYETKSFELTPQNGQVKVQINQTTLPFADIEFVHLNACGVDINPEYAKYVSTGVSVLSDISADDNNVIVNHEKPIEILWNIPSGCSGIATMTMKANEYTSSEANAIRFPYDGVNDQSYNFRNNKSIKVDGTLSQVDGLVKPTYSALWHSNTGHPDGYTYIYMNDDAKNVYLSYDITGDNTNEHGPDWLKIIALNTKDGKQKTYKINDDPSQYGQCGFGLTSKVSYKHETCDVEIPKSDLVGNQLNFYSLYYGTFSGPQFQYLGVSSSPSNTLPVIKVVAVDNSGSGATISSVKFGIRDRDTNPDPDTDPDTVLQYTGTCTADDGTFDSSSENFTCTATEPLSYGVNYAVDLELFEQGSDTPNANGQIYFTPLFTLYNNDYSIVHTFASWDANNGANPVGQFVKSGDLLYGATDAGGGNNVGVIYSIHPDGSDMTVLHTFSSESENRVSDSLVASDSVLYGIVQNGGSNNHGGVFKINMDGSGYSLIYSFQRSSDSPPPIIDSGNDPQGSLIIVGGRLYGLNQWGGDNNSGTIFGLDLDGSNFAVLHSFSGNDGSQPFGSLVESDGVLFGTTYEGGDNNAGTIFSINPDGSNFQHYSLTGEDAKGPTGSLTVIGNDLFGSNQYDGSGGGGDIFKISKNLTGYSVIHTFANNMNDGGVTSLLALQLWNNKLYGDTAEGGDNRHGTLFSMNLDGSDYSLLHEFNGNLYDDGSYLRASPLITDGVMYGVTYQGGASDSGTMYTMTVGGSDSSNIFVSSIVVSSGSTTSVVNGNTLQMNATILPTNASNSNVSWSVTNGTGSATIDSSGLLTATGVGTVTVTASAADESGVIGIEQITIISPPIITNTVITGHGGRMPLPQTTQNITPIITTPPQTTTQISAIQQVIKNLKLGMTNKDVDTLQLFLIAQNAGPAAKSLGKHGTSDYFGTLTKSALSEWQKANGLKADGIFGPKTRAKIKELSL